MRRWIPFTLFLTFVSAVIYAADRSLVRGFFFWLQGVPLGDKLGHVVLIGGLALLLNYALRGRVVRPGIQLGGVLVGVFVVLEEISQLWIPARSFDLWDLFADLVGIACAEMVARRFFRRREEV